MVGGVIRDGINKFDNKVTNGFDVVQQKIKNGFNKMKDGVKREVKKANHTLDKVERDIADGVHLPGWRVNGYVIGKDQTGSGKPTDRSGQKVPAFVSLFSSWNSPGLLCVMGLLASLVVLFSATSLRSGCVVFRYGNVLSPVMPPSQSREVAQSFRGCPPHTPRAEDSETTSTGDGHSRVHLLTAEPAEVE